MKFRIILFSLLFFLLPGTTLAHPGRTASDGCHYCRTNCENWGEDYGERHCHGGSTYTPPPTPPKPKILIPDLSKVSIVFVTSTEVIDGDTIKVVFQDKTRESVRLIGIDTPEIKDPNTRMQCLAKEATNQLKKLVEGKSIKLTQGKKSDNEDKYQRLLRHVDVYDTVSETWQNIAILLIKEGYGFAYLTYPFEKDLMKKYSDAETEAMEAKRGLWSDDTCADDMNTEPTLLKTSTDVAVSTDEKPINNLETIQPRKINFWVSFKSFIYAFFQIIFGNKNP